MRIQVKTLSSEAVEYTDCFSAGDMTPTNEYPRYGTEKSDGDVPVMLELWGMRSPPSLPSLPGPLRFEVVGPGIYGLNRTKLCTYAKLNCLKQDQFDI